MKTKKGKAEQKKRVKNRTVLLYEFTRIIIAIYPKKQTTNPFTEATEKLCKKLSISDYLLFTDTLHCLTLLNGISRENSSGDLISSREDILSAIQLLMPDSMCINTTYGSNFETLRQSFKKSPFTYLEASMLLKCSHSSIKRKLSPLISHGLIEKTNLKSGNRMLLKLNSSVEELPQSEPFLSAFESAFEQWQDYKGFVDF